MRNRIRPRVMPVSAKEITAAFFDLDKTLLSRSSGELYLRVLREQGLIRRPDLIRLFAASLMYKLNLLDPEQLMDGFSYRYRGDSEQEMITQCQQWFLSTVRHYLYREAVERVRYHQEQGHIVALLTAATIYIAEPTGRYLGIKHLLCTRLEVENGLFTGKIIKPICHGKGKLYWAQRFCQEQGIDLYPSYFYTDSCSDLPVLEAVKHPVPVNPDPFLRRVARKRGWPLERFAETMTKEPSP